MNIFDTTINQILAEAVNLSKQTGPPYIVEDEFGNIQYFKDRECDILHRDDGPAVTTEFGDLVWYKDGKLHRLGGPAVERHDGEKKWYVNGNLHRDDGPAVVRPNGEKKWYVNGNILTPEEFVEHKNKFAIKTEIQAHPNNRIDPDMLGEYL